MVGIGFFAPLPLALMMPFMAGQSMMMGDAFGKAYQYGKRKISAMSNEEFNKLTPHDLGQSIVTDYNAIIPSLSQAVKSSSEFQSLIIRELAEILKNLPTDIIQGLTGSGTSPIAPPPPDNQFIPPVPPPSETTILKGIPAFLTPYVGLSGKLNDIANLPPNVVQQILTGQNAVHPSSNFYQHWKNIIKWVTDFYKKGDAPPAEIGPNLPTPPPPDNLLTWNSLTGKWEANDTRAETKLTPSKSIILQLRKLQEEWKSIKIIIQKLKSAGGNSVQLKKFFILLSENNTKQGKLKAKYQF